MHGLQVAADAPPGMTAANERATTNAAKAVVHDLRSEEDTKTIIVARTV
jgi:hypothetical protein